MAMRTADLVWAVTVLAPAALGAAGAGAAEISDYTVEQLLSPCVEADNDARWGAAAEAECEQYISGFTDAFILETGGGEDEGVCLPAQNRPDEIRWAFMRWAYEHYEQRTMPAAKGLLETLKTAFACE